MTVPILLLLVLTAAAFGRVAEFSFLDYDDNAYVTENPVVRRGLTLRGFLWALTALDAANWHPLTWLSHMADVSLFGLRPGGHHLTSLLIHAAAAVLLLAAVVRLGGSRTAAFLAAALFAVHPLRAESVAWVAERKDVLCGLFWMWTLLLWCRHAARPGWRRYLPAAASHLLALLAKPMAVTLPLVLLLLDVWPLGRLRATRRGPGIPLGGLLLEKIPLLLASAGASLLTWLAQSRGGAVRGTDVYPLETRLANALTLPWRYLAKTLVPADLSPLGVHPLGRLLEPAPLAAAAGLAAVTFILWRGGRRCPHLLVGWVWLLVTLVPVAGLVQVGAQGMADRYTYLTLVGPVLALAVHLAAGGRGARRSLLLPAVILLPILLAVLAHRQTGFWRDDETLYRRALAVDPGNWLALNALGKRATQQGDLEGGIGLLRRSLAIQPLHGEANVNLGVALLRLGRVEEALGHLRRGAGIAPGLPEARNALGAALAATGRMAEAAGEYREALRLQPDHAPALNNLGVLLLREGRVGEAEDLLRRALAGGGGVAEAHYNLGVLLGARGEVAAAAAHFREALRLEPGDAQARKALDALPVGPRGAP
jgi:tetratricopeptide (TPR) repeat protein